MKFITATCICLIFLLVMLFSLGVSISVDKIMDKEVNMEDKNIQPASNIYQGPIPEGYDEEHFRKTGETIKEVSE